MIAVKPLIANTNNHHRRSKMRAKRTHQTSIYEAFSKHEIGQARYGHECAGVVFCAGTVHVNGPIGRCISRIGLGDQHAETLRLPRRDGIRRR